MTRPGQRARVVKVFGRVSGGNRLPPDWGIPAHLPRSFGMSDTMVSMSLSVRSPL